jgi:hypothetical protein
MYDCSFMVTARNLVYIARKLKRVLYPTEVKCRIQLLNTIAQKELVIILEYFLQLQYSEYITFDHG